MPDTAEAPFAALDLTEPILYLNRELSWLEFNHRVLEEATERDQPLLERLKFLTIVSSNLDEFFMVRVAGLKRQLRTQTLQRGSDGMSPEEQLRAIATRCHTMVQEQYRCLKRSVLPGLAEQGIRAHRIDDLSADQLRWVKDYFHRQVFPVLTPLALDPSHPFPHLRNRSVNLVVTLRKGRGNKAPVYFAVVQVPAVIPRLVQVPGAGNQFVLLEDVIRNHIAELFEGLEVTGCSPFRITRDSDLDVDEDEAEDLLEAIEEEVRRREWGEAVRLEVNGNIGQRALDELLQALEITEADVYFIDGPLNLVDFMALYRLPDYGHLKDEPFHPPVVRQLQGEVDLFAEIRRGDILLHHPYESFASVSEFVKQAAEDPNVLAIKMTLYRTSGDSPIVGALARAAENGKQVTAVIELKARFDEENNIVWARRLERAGVHVVYGLVGLKIHSKVLLVVRREPGEDRLRRYVHLGTGNYNPTTARLYTDLGLLTASLKYGQDASRLFNVLTGFSEFPEWRRLAVAPVGLRERCLTLVEREAEFARSGQGGRIIAQMNSLTDPEIIRALYRASQAGVKIDLIIRGICCLRPGLPGVSDNIRVISIVGRFLEHCRIFYFGNGDAGTHAAERGEVYLGSADWMNRNLSRRVEVMFPVEDPALKRRLVEQILDVRLRDTVNARELASEGTYTRRKPKRGSERVDSQTWFMQRALQEHAPEPDKPFGADLLVHDPRGNRGVPGEAVGLGGGYALRPAPEGFPAEPTAPPLAIPDAASASDL